MLHIEYIKDAEIICFTITHNSVTRLHPSLPKEEKEHLLRNLEASNIPTIPEKTTTKTDDSTTYNSTEWCYFVEANLFSSVDELIEKTLKGFAKDEAPMFLYSKNEGHSYMFIGNSYKKLYDYYPLAADKDYTNPSLSKN